MTVVDGLSVSHHGRPGAYAGVLKLDGETIWRCPHTHKNRDSDTSNSAARPCASRVLDAIIDPDKTRRLIDAMRRSAPHFVYAWQSADYRNTIARLEWALAEGEALRARLNAGGFHDHA